jgi:hypothetical protein
LVVAVLRQQRWKHDPYMALLHSGTGGMILTEQKHKRISPLSVKSRARQKKYPRMRVLREFARGIAFKKWS